MVLLLSSGASAYALQGLGSGVWSLELKKTRPEGIERKVKRRSHFLFSAYALQGVGSGVWSLDLEFTVYGLGSGG